MKYRLAWLAKGMRKLNVLFAFTQTAQDVQAKYEVIGAANDPVELLHPAGRGIRVLATFHIPLEK